MRTHRPFVGEKGVRDKVLQNIGVKTHVSCTWSDDLQAVTGVIIPESVNGVIIPKSVTGVIIPKSVTWVIIPKSVTGVIIPKVLPGW